MNNNGRSEKKPGNLRMKKNPDLALPFSSFEGTGRSEKNQWPIFNPRFGLAGSDPSGLEEFGWVSFIMN
jgi:hypothetical protein